MVALAKHARLVALSFALVATLVAMLAAAPAPARAAGSLPPIRHVFIVVLENKSYQEAFTPQAAAPYLAQTLPSIGALVPNYFGVTHNSLGNYVALVSGQGSNPITQSDCQIYTDVLPGTLGADGQAIGSGCVYPASVKTVADQLTAAGLTWKGYMQDMGNAAGESQSCSHPAFGTVDRTQSARQGDEYATRHNPFVYFHSLLDSGACARYDVPLTQLPGDLSSAATTPNYVFITPNLCADGHDASCVGGGAGGLAGVDGFLRSWVPQILSSPAYQQDGLLAVIFDETDDGTASSCCQEPQFPNTPDNGFTTNGLGGGQTGAVLLSPFISAGTVDQTAYNHFTMLRSVEDLFGLGHLGYAGLAGEQSLGADAFTCYQPGESELRSAAVQRAGRHATLQVELWRAGAVTVKVRYRRKRHHRWRWRRVGKSIAAGGCQTVAVRLPHRHGRVRVSAQGLAGSARRTIKY